MNNDVLIRDIYEHRKVSQKTALTIEKQIPGFEASIPARLVGLEVEMERANGIMQHVLKHNPEARYCFTVVKDGSLRDEGIEWVSYPMSESHLRTALSVLNVVYTAYPVNFTHRCSYHVHVDVQDITWDNLRLMTAAYLCLEKLFFSEVSPDRQNNPFCVPLADAFLTKRDFNFHDNPINQEEALKYFAFNLNPVRNFGTVEFRHSNGHKDVVKLGRWIRLCRTFVDFFKDVNYKEVRKMILELNTASEYNGFIEMIFGYNPWPDKDLNKYISECNTMSKGLL